MESATFSSIRASKVDERELMRCLYPEEVSDVGLIRVAFDAAGKETGEITVFHRRAINELMDRFVSRQLNTSMWEAAEALRELQEMHAQDVGESAKEALALLDEMELQSISGLMTTLTTGNLHGGPEKVAKAIKCLADHFVRGRFQYDDEEHFSILLFRTLRDENNAKILFEAASALELLGNKESLSQIQDSLRNRSWGEFPEVKRKLLMAEHRLCRRFGENPVEIVNDFPASRRRTSSPPSSENTFVRSGKVNKA